MLEMPHLVQDYSYNRVNGERYQPVLERDPEGFLLCSAVYIYENEDLRRIDSELQRSGYRLASREEMERYLTSNDLFQVTDERIVYGSGYVWVKDGYWRSNNFTDQGFILSTDDERIRSQHSVPLSDNSYGGEHNTYRTIIAITSIKDREIPIDDEDEDPNEKYLLEIEEKLRSQK
jgi:hypothetical protein